jgi:anti-sigma regulatory factor (Ser/Thr protein kinase)
MILPLSSAFFDLILNSKINKIIKGYGIFCSIIIIPNLFAPLPALIDILLIWQLSALFFLPYILYIISKSLIKEIKRIKSENLKSQLSVLISAFFTTLPGNLVLGATVTALCGIFDIVDALYFYSGIASLKYGFLFFLTSISLILAKRFHNLFTEVENLNTILKNNIDHLNIANKVIALSEKKYRLLVEGSEDIIFSLDENWKLITANKAISNILKLNPSRITGLSFYDLLWDGSEANSISRQLIHEKISKFINDKLPVQFKIDFKTQLAGEPIELNLKLEHINIEGKNEILGKASSVVEDNLLKYFISEKQNYVIGNYFVTSDEISYRMTRTAIKFTDQKTVTVLRIALREIIINAIEHGNLNISFQEKTDSMINDDYFNLLRDRQMSPEYRNKTIDIKYKIDKEKVIYQIIDEGKGFDYKSMLNGETSSRANDEMLSHGRGIEMAKNVFDKIIYRDDGTRIILVKYFNI